MNSTPRSVLMLANDLEERLENLRNNGIHDDRTLSNLESLVNQCSNQLNQLISTLDSTLISILLPTLLRTIIALTKICSEKSDLIISGPYISQEKLTTLINNTKTLYNQLKEFFKSNKLNTSIIRSIHLRHFCEQLHQTSDLIANIDVVLTLICHKLIVKLLTGGDDYQQTQQQRIDDINDDLIIAIYGSVVRQLNNLCGKYARDCKETSFLKMYGIYFQMIHRLIQCNSHIVEQENYNEFFRTIINIHICLESTCQQNRFQLEFFNNTLLLQEILQYFISFALNHSSKIFFQVLSYEITNNSNHYASLIVLFRMIEILNQCLSKYSNDISIYILDQFISNLFSLIDQCSIQLALSALLPTSFGKSQVEYGSFYDITYSLLMKLFHHQSMQTVIIAMTNLIHNSSIILTSNQLAYELIIQSWFFYQQSRKFQELFGLFLAELLRLDIHSIFIQHLLTLPNIRSVKFRAYDALISSNSFHRIYEFCSTIEDHISKEPLFNLSLIFPMNIDHLYPFIRLFNTELNSHQIQHTIDTCIYSIQQFLSLTIITEFSCRFLILIVRLLSYLTVNNNEHFKCLLGQLTQIFILLDEQTANDIRLEFLQLFAKHSNNLDDNDLGRLLDFILTNPIETNSNSIAFHLNCLDIIDSLRQRTSRSTNITDLIIQLIVRYGNEHQCFHLLKAHLMRIFLAYIYNGNDDSLPMRVKSQCVLLRASVDEFEKNKKLIGTKNERYPDESILQILDASRPTMMTINKDDRQLKFHQMIVNQLEFDRSSTSIQNSDAMQQD